MAIIKSLLDTDLYKFTMWQVALHQFATVEVVYEFKCRNRAAWTPALLAQLEAEFDAYCQLRFTPEELDYLRGLRYLKPGFVHFLSLYQAKREHLRAWLDGDELRIEVRGPWFLTMPFEVPVLAMVNELWFRAHAPDPAATLAAGRLRLAEKLRLLGEAPTGGFSVSDFGTRRRFSREWQEEVVRACQGLGCFAGSSNVDLARRLGLVPIGTMAHEFLMVGQALDDVPLVRFQRRMLQAWVDEYRGDLGIALSDTVGLEAFLADFDRYFAKLYDGVRHDSGDPHWWAERVLDHYRELGIDARGKTLVFSDGLTPAKALELAAAFAGRARLAFGIGTNLTNDFPGLEPLQIVMKIVEANGRAVAKLSDSPGKGMCHDPGFLAYLKQVFRLA